MIGTVLGVFLARWGTRLFVTYFRALLDVSPDARVLAFTGGIAIVTGLLSGMLPAWQGTRVRPQSAMKSNARGVIEGGKFGLGKALVAAQIALSLVLVVGAGLMVSTFWKLVSLDPGIDPRRVLLVQVDLRNGNYPVDHRLPILREMLEKLRAAPGVASASASAIVPMCGCRSTVNLTIEGVPRNLEGEAIVNLNRVSDGFFETLGTPIVAGRDFNAHDTLGSPQVAIINQTLAKKYFGAMNPIGKHYRYREGNELSGPVEIVGIVKDAKYAALREEIPATVYAAWSQGKNSQLITYFELRSAGGLPSALSAGVKSAIAAVNPSVSFQFRTLQGEIDASLDGERLLAVLSGFFGALADLLATIGLYGVMSYNIARRRNEIGVRMALGAEQARVLRMVLGEVALLIGVGLAIGLCAALATTRLVAGFLYGLRPNDPIVLCLAAAVLAGVALLAGYLPARRASRLDPMAALREE